MEAVEAEKAMLEKRLLKANSETDAWRRKSAEFEVDLMTASKVKDEAVHAATRAERKCNQATAALSGVQEQANQATDGQTVAEVHVLSSLAELESAEASLEARQTTIELLIEELAKLRTEHDGSLQLDGDGSALEEAARYVRLVMLPRAAALHEQQKLEALRRESAEAKQLQREQRERDKGPRPTRKSMAEQASLASRLSEPKTPPPGA